MNFVETAAVMTPEAVDTEVLPSMDERLAEVPTLSGKKQFIAGLVGALVIFPFMLFALNAGVTWSIDHAYASKAKASYGAPIAHFGSQANATAQATNE